ncbi:alpha/beta hydrolase [Alkalimarinus alittae]|uniref:Alpha/beta hydrolase n=1 Tax=Alkalimarinus alittae TaxID=2961619 RepID=A0ABY6MZL1_9ALTE|nr:alpha/beta hydrolase [Alkalimarinus alittae]UZE95278.1 alpha/beta hydrolase [Alkalimarinus alittae]
MSSSQSKVTRWVVKKLIAPILNADTPIVTQRKRLDRLAGAVPLPRRVKSRALKIRDIPALWIDVNAKNQRVILFLHGGAYNIGSIESHKEYAARLGLASDANVLLIDYRLAPEHPFPAGLEDALAAYQWLLVQGYSGRNIAIAGDSAGGGLALSTAMSVRDKAVELPACLCLMSPWTDLTMSGESIKRNAHSEIMLNALWMRQLAHNYAGPDGLANPLASPHFGEYKGLPPIMTHVAESELLLSDARRMTQKAKQAGVSADLEAFRNVWHIWHTHAGFMPESKHALKKMGAFIKSNTDIG